MTAGGLARRTLMALTATSLLVISPAASPQEHEGGAADRVFAAQVDAYVALHRSLEARLPSYNPAGDPWGEYLQHRYLAAAIRSARWHAVQGDVFTPVAVGTFRARIAAALSDAEARAAIARLDADGWPVDSPAVNEPLPHTAAHPVPAAIRQRLPALPDGIEFRIVTRDLVLWDSHADLVIDVLPRAFRP